MASENKIPTFKAAEALEIYRNVKAKIGSTTEPKEVLYADGGEGGLGITQSPAAINEDIPIKTLSFPGKILATAGGAIPFGSAVYPAADGKLSATPAGLSVGIAVSAASGDGSLFEIVPTVVGSVGLTTESISLNSMRAAAGEPLVAFVDGASETPGFDPLNDSLVLRWNNHTTHGRVKQSIAIPWNIDVTRDIVIGFWAKLTGATDTPVLEVAVQANDVVADIAGTNPELTGGTTLTHYTCNIAAANVPAYPGVININIRPTNGEMTTDDLLVYGIWYQLPTKPT